MKVLVACEFSGIVRDAFAKRGHEVWSCDLLPSERREGKHIQRDILKVLEERNYGDFDLMIAFPPCTDLAVSGARYFKEKRTDGRQRKAIEFFMELVNCNIKRTAIENPVGIMSTLWRKPDQIIQPWQFGHRESKKTCLWLKGLPILVPTQLMTPDYVKDPGTGKYREIWENQTPSGQNKLGPSPTRAIDRARTYQGIADAMAEQWGLL